jgi:hypothetical protein
MSVLYPAGQVIEAMVEDFVQSPLTVLNVEPVGHVYVAVDAVQD